MTDSQKPVQEALPDVLIAKTSELGERLKRARLRRQLTLRACAKATGISPIALRRLERGDPRISFAELLVLLNYYGLACDIDGICRNHFDRLAPNLQQGDPIPLLFDLDN